MWLHCKHTTMPGLLRQTLWFITIEEPNELEQKLTFESSLVEVPDREAHPRARQCQPAQEAPGSGCWARFTSKTDSHINLKSKISNWCLQGPLKAFLGVSWRVWHQKLILSIWFFLLISTCPEKVFKPSHWHREDVRPQFCRETWCTGNQLD